VVVKSNAKDKVTMQKAIDYHYIAQFTKYYQIIYSFCIPIGKQ